MKIKMPVFYISGPYSGTTKSVVGRNIKKASRIAQEIWKLGGVAICPHTNCAFFEGDYELFLLGDLRLLELSDAIIMIPGWEKSRGSRVELERAKALNLNIFYWPNDKEKIKSFIKNFLRNNIDYLYVKEDNDIWSMYKRYLQKFC